MSILPFVVQDSSEVSTADKIQERSPGEGTLRLTLLLFVSLNRHL
jgi:hypothetical protein